MPLLQCDAAQLEWRVALELSRDPIGIEEVLKGADTHSLNQETFQLPSRLIAKIYLFRTIFRGSGYSFSVDPDFMHVSSSSKFWDDVNEKFYRKYAGLDKQHKVWADLVLHGKPIVGPLGREWMVPMKLGAFGHDFKIPWTTLTNYPVQGTGADVMMVARISAFRRIKASGLPVIFRSTVHDSILVDVPTEHLQEVANIFHQVFDDLIPNIKKIFGYDWVVPMACENKFGPDMKNMTKMLDTRQKV